MVFFQKNSLAESVNILYGRIVFMDKRTNDLAIALFGLKIDTRII